MGFSRRESWTGWPYLLPGSLPSAGIKPVSLLSPSLAGGFVTLAPPGSKCLLISCPQSPSSVILEPKKRKSVTASTFSSSICHEVMGLDAMILDFSVLHLSQLLTLLFHPHQGFFSSSSFPAIRVVPSAYLRLLIFLLAIWIPACDSSSLAFHMHSACKLNKQGDYIQPWHTPFPVLN